MKVDVWAPKENELFASKFGSFPHFHVRSGIMYLSDVYLHLLHDDGLPASM